MSETKCFGDRGEYEKTHDNLVCIEVKRKYAYITRYSRGRQWVGVGKVKKSEATKVKTFEQADRLYDEATDREQEEKKRRRHGQ